MRVFWPAGVVAGIILVISAVLFFYPQIDLIVAGAFYDGQDFIWRDAPLPMFLHDLVRPSGWVFGVLLSVGLFVSLFRQPFLKLDRRAWFFLLVSLAAGPGLLTNVVLKDHWDRARPRQIEQFGGEARFSRPLIIVSQCQRNCAFVSGDAALAFWLHSFAYVVARHRRRVLVGGLTIGAGVGLLRIGMGAHFLSDVFFAGLFMVMTSAFVFALAYGGPVLQARWRQWLSGSRASSSATA